MQKKLEQQKASSLDILRKSKADLRRSFEREREKNVALEVEVRQMKKQMREAAKAPPPAPAPVAPKPAPAKAKPPPPPPPMPPPMPLKVAASADGLVKLTSGIGAGDVIVVTGAEGLTGRLVVENALAQYPSATVRACARELGPLTEAMAPYKCDRLECVEADLYDAAAYPALFSGASAVLWCASSFGQQKPGSAVANLVEQALLALDDAGARHP